MAAENQPLEIEVSVLIRPPLPIRNRRSFLEQMTMTYFIYDEDEFGRISAVVRKELYDLTGRLVPIDHMQVELHHFDRTIDAPNGLQIIQSLREKSVNISDVSFAVRVYDGSPNWTLG